MPNKKTKKQLKKEGKTKKEIDLYFGINEKTGRPVKWTEEKALELANELIEWMKSSENNIFFERFLVQNKDIPSEMISILSKKFKSFFQSIKKAKKIQEHRIIDIGLKPKDSSVASLTQNLNKKSVTEKDSSTFAMFLLKSNHGYMEESQKQTNEIKLQELELKKQMMELTKKQHEDDLIHTITFDDSNPIINP
jgi:hypothetical protein